MTTVIHLASRSAGTPVQTSAHSRAPKSALAVPATTHGVGTVDRQAAIENALNMALYFMRQPGDTAENLWAATARTNRALTMLKQASAGAANHTERG
jgi:hypothetical protein